MWAIVSPLDDVRVHLWGIQKRGRGRRKPIRTFCYHKYPISRKERERKEKEVEEKSLQLFPRRQDFFFAGPCTFTAFLSSFPVTTCRGEKWRIYRRPNISQKDAKKIETKCRRKNYVIIFLPLCISLLGSMMQSGVNRNQCMRVSLCKVVQPPTPLPTNPFTI